MEGGDNYATLWIYLIPLKCWLKHGYDQEEFPCGPAVTLRVFTAEGTGSIPGQETKVLKATQHVSPAPQKSWVLCCMNFTTKKEVKRKRTICSMIPFIWSSRTVKEMWNGDHSGKEHKGTLWTGWNVLYLNMIYEYTHLSKGIQLHI